MAEAAAVGGALGAVGSITQGNGEKDLSDFNARTATQNGLIAVRQANENARRASISSTKQMGAMRAGYGASGVTTEGSAMDVLMSSAANAKLDELTIQNQGQIKAAAYMNEAALDQYKGKNAQTAGYMGAASSILKGGAAMAGGIAGGGGASGYLPGDDQMDWVP